ncbi:hypothetical protein RGU70_16585 [Herbaspirillum sp. RTI4]|uniref:hypothetical protein n=1 Tax=Herbaspirillum sp. RTI4 TaxID=3048640 RepID=UPI002AB5DBAD|nr:hypothetical protein [Herbaspirillum sp. RTI4]MDY7579932.1 hypothetical protein [Herbaspirillum sp. RTI4]MEA9983325.1 hypothetical protein [Herbaspirillum sp. RTI4]
MMQYFWPSLVNKYNLGEIMISPIDNDKKITSLLGSNDEFDWYINYIGSRHWRCLNAHDARVFQIESPGNVSVAWLSWLGHRGCRWHCVNHFPLSGPTILASHDVALQDVIDRYQIEWKYPSSLEIRSKRSS